MAPFKAKAAQEAVNSIRLTNGMAVGIGSGSTVVFAVESLEKRCAAEGELIAGDTKRRACGIFDGDPRARQRMLSKMCWFVIITEQCVVVVTSDCFVAGALW